MGFLIYGYDKRRLLRLAMIQRIGGKIWKPETSQISHDDLGLSRKVVLKPIHWAIDGPLSYHRNFDHSDFLPEIMLDPHVSQLNRVNSTMFPPPLLRLLPPFTQDTQGTFRQPRRRA